MAFAFWKPVCYVLGANRRVSAGSRRVFYFPSPTFPPSNHKSIAVLSFAIEYISARIAFPPPVCYFHVSKFLPLASSYDIKHDINTRQFGTRVEWQKIL